MSNEDKQAPEDQIEEVVDTEVSQEEAALVDELTQANFRIEELEQALSDAQSHAQEEKDAALRAVAEMENIRRRAALDVDKAHKFALEKFANELLPVIDNMERALLGSVEDDAAKAVIEGVELTLKTLITAVAKFGIVVVDPAGEAFNPDHHQAIGMQPSEEHPANTVMQVMQKGYLLNERLLRPAMVMVSQG